MRERTNEADATAAKASSLLEDRAAEIRVLMTQLQQAQKEMSGCRASPMPHILSQHIQNYSFLLDRFCIKYLVQHSSARCKRFDEDAPRRQGIRSCKAY